MRSRSNSGVRLDYYQRIVHKIIMKHQNAVTGLFPASPENDHAWVRDNVYCILAVWGLSMAYKKIADADEDRAKTYELEQSCVKLMRGLLMAMMQQKEKVERFKSSQNPNDALHAKYSSVTEQTVVGDTEWGHLQIDAISLYLLILAQMTASGLQIVFNLEVAFIQNLVFYIESAYCTPDYGIWERGDKTNHGLPELNASSIGMAKAAMEAMNELDLFGARGGPTSVIHVLADEAQKCQAVLQSMLPRESNSKELDSGLLSVISFPAFAIDEPNLIQLTRDAITKKLQGRYGCKRFLRDGYKTPKEDPNRLYYEPWELRMFENIECEWPLFFCYLIVDYCFQGNNEAVTEYTEQLEEIMIKAEDGIKLVPELYSVEAVNVSAEYAEPGSQKRIALGRCPFMWAQSLYILGKLLQEGFLAVGELDPLNRRLCSEKKPDVVVQVVILAEDAEIREKIAQHDIHVQTIAEVAPIEVQPAKVLSHLYTYLGRNQKLGLSGRKSRDVGILSTSKLYSLNDKIFAFTPQLTDMTRFYIASDYELMIDIFKGEINFLKSSWQNMLGRPLVVMPLKNIHLGTNFDAEEYYTTNDAALLVNTFTTNLAFLTINWKQMLGRPTITLVATHNHLDQGKIPLAMITTMKKLKSGYINGTRVSLGNLNDFLSTSCITNLSFLGSSEDGRPDKLNSQVLQTNMYNAIFVDSQGLYFNTGMVEESYPVLIKDLLKDLYEKACQQKLWGIVRHTAGMLGKRVEDLAKAVTDLLVRQKQVTVGMPPTNEHTIVAPLPENELRALIHQAYGDDESTAMLTQELLVYLAMFIRTEPQLFHEMLRLRVGLIIQVMATELSRTLICTGEEASEHLLNLSPFEMKNLLHHIMSGKEFAISSVGRGNFSVISCKSSRVSKKSQIGGFLSPDQTDANEIEPDRQGQWLRRRRLDGALNRVPRDFYPRVWQVLERCQGLAIEGRVLPQNLTQEMTPGELKFALAVETVLNTIPQPEYRQLVVEALMVLTLVTEYNVVTSLGGLIAVEQLVHKANAIFLDMKIDGDATLCCAKPKEQRETTAMGNLLCGGAAYVCQHFYDSAPSGSFGTMTYITRAISSLLNCLPKDGDLECTIS
ncbi:putative phosphorylase b kinase regulatory subunit alpha [Habropoda laboriosa]|uniref:Phosphorylase b kinase regulatory subunit n=1 Tax=Habropoda laboriosa TaxID=597456 RepID=A0A0L7RF49_9HYME|nr:putative phosphorylase b kinase regulatory subunit alpha [Habropoda laboriosa]